jgi:hypothetical protein
MNRILYVGQGGTTAGHGDVYRCDIAVNVCDETTDFSVAYDSATAERVTALAYNFRDQTLWAGFGNATGNGDIYRCEIVATSCDATGDWVLSYDGSLEEISSLAYDSKNNTIYAGQGTSAGAGDIFRKFEGDYKFSDMSFVITGASGSAITTATSTIPVGGMDYLFFATVSNIADGDAITFALANTDVVGIGEVSTTSASRLTVSGSVTNAAHSRTANPALDQVHYRWRNDDGNEIAASWATTEDNPLSSGVFPGDRRRLRFSVSNASAAANNITYRLEYTSVGGCASGWTAVPSAATTEHWQMDPSYYLSEEGASTAQLSVPAGKTFAAGFTKQSSNQTSAHDLTSSGYSEFEYALKSTANAATETTYCFRLTNAGSITNFTYTQTPSITLSVAARPQTGGGGAAPSGSGSPVTGGTGQGGGTNVGPTGGGGQQSGGSGQGGGGGSQEFVPWLMPWFGYAPDIIEAGAASLASLLRIATH